MYWLLFSVVASVSGYSVGSFWYEDRSLEIASGSALSVIEIRELMAFAAFFFGSWFYTFVGKSAHWILTYRSTSFVELDDIYDEGSSERLDEIELRIGTIANLHNERWRLFFMWSSKGNPKRINSNKAIRYRHLDISGIETVGQLTSEVEDIYAQEFGRTKFFVIIEDRHGNVLHGNTKLPQGERE